MSHKKHAVGDRNFDGLTPRFSRNIYNSPKGKLRLAVLARDFQECLPQSVRTVLDIGAGQGQCALALRQQRAVSCVLNDISEEMLAEAKARFEQEDSAVVLDAEGKRPEVRFVCSPVQSLAEHVQQRFDLVICHALIEWLEDPRALFKYLQPFVQPGTYLSLIFYNLHGLIYKNLLRQNFSKIEKEDYRGYRGSLTPIHAFKPETMVHWAADAGYEVVCQSGIRVFHDYILDPVERNKFPDDAVKAELKFSRELPYRDLGRYIHLLCRKI